MGRLSLTVAIVVRVDEHLKEIVPAPRSGPTFIDDPVDIVVQDRDRRAARQVRWCRHPFGDVGQGPEAALDVAQEHRHCVVELFVLVIEPTSKHGS